MINKQFNLISLIFTAENENKVEEKIIKVYFGRHSVHINHNRIDIFIFDTS